MLRLGTSFTMNASFANLLLLNGPDQCQALSETEARAWATRHASRRRENFTVLSRLVPENLRDDFGALYAFCRWSDDLADEMGDRERSLHLLTWWREELHRCMAGDPRHPVFVALAPTIRRHDLPRAPFEALIAAFEQDQRLTRYDTWDDLLAYCRGSADPVGRLVLMICGEAREERLLARSDDICTALQLTNHWQDVCRDILERDRIYLPRQLHSILQFDDRLRRSAAQGFGVDRVFLEESRQLVRECVKRTWPLFERGEGLLDMVSSRTRPIIWLFLMGGERTLRLIEMWNFETALHRPALSKVAKAALVARAWWMKQRGGNKKTSPEVAST